MSSSQPHVLMGHSLPDPKYVGSSSQPYRGPGYGLTPGSALTQPGGPGLPQARAGLSPSAWFADPLTSALQHLSNVVDPEATARSTGMSFRPEFYSLHKGENIPVRQLDHKKMSYKQLLYGMVCVAQHIRSVGSDIDGYLNHLEFVTRHACDDSYQDLAYTDYDRYVTDHFLKHPAGGFVMADQVGIRYSFHAARLNVDFQEKMASSGNRQKRKGFKKTVKSDGIPDGYPEGNCYYWNYKTCVVPSCVKKHVYDSMGELETECLKFCVPECMVGRGIDLLPVVFLIGFPKGEDIVPFILGANHG